jgi:hypothetical protein
MKNQFLALHYLVQAKPVFTFFGLNECKASQPAQAIQAQAGTA